MDRATTIQSYLQAGKSVCPFAKVSPLELVTVSANPRDDRTAILQSITAFAVGRGNALVILAKTDKALAATTAWAVEAFLELMICCSQVSQPTIPIEDIERHVAQVIRPVFSSPKIRPHLGLHDKVLMTICMAPVYPTTHPRYAPHTILVVTWCDDVGAALGTAAVPKIREAMAKEHGYVYDANELVLPLPVVARTAGKLKMWVGNFDGSRQGLVIASTKEGARKIAGTGRSDFDGHWTQHSDVDPTLDPEVLYTRPFTHAISDRATPWHRGRCSLPPRKETKP